MVHLFDEMVKTIPNGTRLNTMKQAGDILTLEGIAESNSRVASYMRSIDTSPWMGRSDLRKIENKTGTTGVDSKLPYVFSLDVKLRKPEDAQKQDAQDGTPEGAPAADASATPPADLGAQLEDASRKLIDQKTPPPPAPGGAPAQPTTPAAEETK
jgi:type IV pilus assembly protein PilN